MNPTRFLPALLAAASLLAGAASAQNSLPVRPGQMVDTRYSGHLFFGDSLSDNGNLYVATGGTNPLSPPYNQRFTNELVFAEYLVPGLSRILPAPTQLNNIDFAFGGATAAPAANPPGFAQQIGLYQGLGQTIGSNQLVSVFFGANDFFNAVGNPANQNSAAITALANASATYVNNGVQSLIAQGGRNFIVFYLPDLSHTPAFLNSPANPLAQLYTTTFNGALQTSLGGTLGTAPAGTRITIVNAYAFLNQILANPARFGLTNVTTPYLPAATGNVNQYLFFDAVHPTATVQMLEAMFVNELLNPQWPLASTAALNRASLGTLNLIADTTLTRLDTIRSNSILGGTTSTQVVTDPKSGAKSTVATPADRKSTFDLYGSYNYLDGSAEGDGSTFATKYHTNMGTVGADFTLSCGLTAGLSGNFASTSGTVANGGNYSMDTNVVQAYLMWRRAGSFFIDGSFGGGSVDINKINRPTNVPGIIATGNTSGSLIDGHVRVGYEFKLAPGFVVGPVLGYRFLQSQLNAYSETNGGGMEFSYNRQTTTANLGTFGFFANYQGKLGRMDMSFRLNAVYLYDFTPDNQTISGRLRGNLTPNTYINTYAGMADTFNVGVGATAWLTRRVGLSVDYVGGIPRDGTYSNRVQGSIGFKF